LYSKSFGKASLRRDRDEPFTEFSVCSIASLTKLMTSVAVLQCVEQGKLNLDQDARPMFALMGQHGVITSFDDERNAAVLEANAAPITLRMLLTHTSGHEYDWLNPLLGKWRASRGKAVMSGATLDEKSATPLVFAPGAGFAYGQGHDWAGRAVELVTGSTLDEYMCQHIWAPLGIENDTTFSPKTAPGIWERIVDLSTLNEKGQPPAVDASERFDQMLNFAECFGGIGVFTSAAAFYTFLSAVFRRDARLLQPDSYEVLFRPQLDAVAEQAMNDYLHRSPMHTQLLAMGIPPTIRKTWSLAGMVAQSGQEGRFGKGTTLWEGMPNLEWFMDHEAGVCGTAFCQVLPPLHPNIMSLHEQFQREVFGMVQRGR